jgi:hypothetical protein
MATPIMIRFPIVKLRSPPDANTDTKVSRNKDIPPLAASYSLQPEQTAPNLSQA